MSIKVGSKVRHRVVPRYEGEHRAVGVVLEIIANPPRSWANWVYGRVGAEVLWCPDSPHPYRGAHYLDKLEEA